MQRLCAKPESDEEEEGRMASPLMELADAIFWRDLLCELLGTFFLLVAHSILGMPYGGAPVPLIIPALGSGCTVFVIVEALADMSGGLVNPAVSIGLASSRVISPIKAVGYTIVELTGAMAGAALVYSITPTEYKDQMQPVGLRPSVTVWQGFAAETVMTSFLLFVATSVYDNRNRVIRLPSIAIGLTVAANILMFDKLTGAGMNPAVAFAVAVVTGTWRPDHWIYWVGTILGGVIGASLYTYVLVSLTRRFSPRPEKIHPEKHNLLIETIPVLLSQKIEENNGELPARLRKASKGNELLIEDMIDTDV